MNFVRVPVHMSMIFNSSLVSLDSATNQLTFAFDFWTLFFIKAIGYIQIITTPAQPYQTNFSLLRL